MAELHSIAFKYQESSNEVSFRGITVLFAIILQRWNYFDGSYLNSRPLTYYYTNKSQ